MRTVSAEWQEGQLCISEAGEMYKEKWRERQLLGGSEMGKATLTET